MCAVVMICATLVNTQTHKQTQSDSFWLVILLAQPLRWAKKVKKPKS